MREMGIRVSMTWELRADLRVNDLLARCKRGQVDFRFAPKATEVRLTSCASCRLMRRSKKRLFDHLVGGRKEVMWHFEADHSCGPEIEGELELGGLLDR